MCVCNKYRIRTCFLLRQRTTRSALLGMEISCRQIDGTYISYSFFVVILHVLLLF